LDQVTSGVITHSPQSPFDLSTSQYHGLGTKFQMADGRVFYYAKHTLSTTLSRGLLMTQAAVAANHQNRTTTGVAGNKTVTVAIGATALTAGQYEDGYFWADSGTGAGQFRRIRSHGVSAGSTTETITLYDEIDTTFAATPTGSLQKNLFRDFVVHPGNAQLAGCPVGVVNIAVGAGDTTAQYFWVQTWGPTAVSCEGSITAGQMLAPATAATTDAGQFKLAAGLTTVDDPVLAICIGPNGTDEHWALADLRIRS
jgi:hypothetical protein